MKIKLLTSIFVIFFLIAFHSNAQDRTNVQKLQQISQEKSLKWQAQRALILAYSRSQKVPIRQVLPNGRIIEMVGIENGIPVYFTTTNENAAITTGTNELYIGGSLGLNLDGTGYDKLAVWDGGAVLTSHQEFNNTGSPRVSVADGTTSTSAHATHVAGTMVAGGVNSGAKGMAFNATLDSYYWNNDGSEMAAAAANGLEISNHSYGYIRGWSDGTWYGDPNISTQEDYKFGFYDSSASYWDQIAYNAPHYLIVKSAGNDRNDSGNGSYPPDGGSSGYDCIGTRGIAKNILTVGSVLDVSNYTGPSSVTLNSFSSWGPADDGRIKPDIVANGNSLYSSVDNSNSSYSNYSGTSMSTPNTSGTLALLQQHYQNLNSGTSMRSATLKALVINTAKECGVADGPDYQFGWGLLNAEAAADIITKENNNQAEIVEDYLANGESDVYTILVDGTQPLKVTIVWTDPEHAALPPALDPSTSVLINDLDARINFGGNNYYPYKLDGNNPSNIATNTSENNIDNVEHIYISNTTSGVYTLTIDHDGSLSNNQYYSIIINGGSFSPPVISDFAMLGDFGEVSVNATNVANLVNGWNIDYIVTAGDNRYGSINYDSSIGDKYCQWLKDAGNGINCSSGTATENKFFPSPGNHEYSDGGGINEYLDYFTLPGAGVASTNTSGNERYYDFIQGDVHFFMLDSDAAINNAVDRAAQQNWLQIQLGLSTSIWKVVVLHHAPYSSGNHGSIDLMQWPYANWGADVVLAGHDHHYERIQKDGIHYIVNGLGGRSIYNIGTPISGSQVAYNGDYGALKVSVFGNEMNVKFINVSGVTIDDYTIQKSVPPPPIEGVLDVQVSSGLDDVEERLSDGVVDTNSSDIELGNDPGFNENQTVGLLFRNLNITQGSIITSAYLEFEVDEVDTGSTIVTVKAENSDNASDFVVSTNNVTNRATTTASVIWDIPAWNTISAKKQSPDISALVQEIVNRVGWTSGNKMAFIINGTGSRTAEAYEGEAANAVKLHIEFNEKANYCASNGNGTDSFKDVIRLVSFNTINNATPIEDNGYSDFIAISTTVQRNESYNLSVNVNTDGNYTNHVWAWIDWNQDGDFVDAGESYDLGSATNVTNGASSLSPLGITIPNEAIIGTTRMRVSTKYNADPNSCETGFDGEVEDYSIDIENSNAAPVFVANPLVKNNATEDVAYVGDISGDATDADGDVLIFSKVSGPTWLIVASDGTLSGTPLNDDVGLNSIVVEVDDSNGGTAQTILEITVMNVNDAPIFVSDPIIKVDANINSSYISSLASDVVDDDGDVLSFSKTAGPAWLVVDPDGSLSGIPNSTDVGINSFTVEVNDGNGGTDTTTVEITVVAQSFCDSYGISSNKEWIEEVSFNGVTNTSGNDGGYGDYTGIIFDLDINTSVNFSLDPNYIRKSTWGYWAIYIDYNNDSDFNDSGELVYTSGRGKNTKSGSFTTSSNSGLFKMRVSMNDSSTPGPCEIFAEGEVEDYMVNIQIPTPQAPITDFSASSTNISIGESIQFTDTSSNSPTSWSWTFDGGSPSVSVSQNPIVTYNTIGVYNVSLTATNSIGSDTLLRTAYVTVTEDTGSNYCEPVSINNNRDHIVSINLDGVTSNSGKSGTGYDLFTSPSFNFTEGQTIATILQPLSSKNRNSWRIWVDLNGDNDFDDANELLLAVDNHRNTFSASFTIPNSVVASTRMRISMKKGGGASPCGDGFNGEVEDYMINILSSASNSSTASKGVQINSVDSNSVNSSLLEVTIYPNPTGKYLNISLRDWKLGTSIKISDILGKIILQRPIDRSARIDVSSFPSGVYFIHTKNENISDIKKFIVK